MRHCVRGWLSWSMDHLNVLEVFNISKTSNNNISVEWNCNELLFCPVDLDQG